MLYEYNRKIYVKPFSNKIVEVEIHKKFNEYEIKATDKVLYLDKTIKKEISEISIEEAYKKANKKERDDTL